MRQPKLRIKTLGVCALALAVMGISASGAQGAGSWLVLEGSTVTEGIGGEVTFETDIRSVIHSKISGAEVLFECPTIEAVGAKLAAGGTIAKGAKIKLSGCITKLNGVESKACEPSNGGTEKGVISTKALHAALVLNAAKEELLEVTPDEGETFWTTEMGKECSIGTKVPVIGKLLLKDCESLSGWLTHKEKHLMEIGTGTELWVISKTEEHKAFVLSSFWKKVKTHGVFRSFAGHAG